MKDGMMIRDCYSCGHCGGYSCGHCRPRMTILRGIPGCGKTAIARKSGDVVVSADDYFTRGGAYNFDPSRLGEAHAACFRGACEAVMKGENVTVDNTNTTAMEMAPYVALAAAYGYAVTIVTVRCPVDVAMKRQTHGVPEHAIRRMDTLLRECSFPPYWNVDTRVELT